MHIASISFIGHHKYAKILLDTFLLVPCQSKLSMKLPWVKLAPRAGKLVRPRQGHFLCKWKQEIDMTYNNLNYGLLTIKTQSFNEKKINFSNKLLSKVSN